MNANRLHHDQTGMVGKIAVVWIVIGVLFVVAAFDGIAIGFSKYRVADLAGNGASQAALDYKASGKAGEACAAAIAYVTDHDKEAHVPTDGCVIDPTTGVATLTVRKVASTLIAQRLSFTEDLTHLESTESVEPPI